MTKQSEAEKENTVNIEKISVMEDALKAIASFPKQEPMFDYCRRWGVKFNELEPPYLTMAKVAIHANGLPA